MTTCCAIRGVFVIAVLTSYKYTTDWNIFDISEDKALKYIEMNEIACGIYRYLSTWQCQVLRTFEFYPNPTVWRFYLTDSILEQ